MNYTERIRAETPDIYLSPLAGQRVVLVGPAASITGRGLGQWIESHDLVVRMNLSCPPPAEMQPDIGLRTDILYHRLLSANMSAAISRVHCPSEITTWKENGVRWVATSQAAGHSRTQLYQRSNKDMLPLLTLGDRIMPLIKKWTGASSPSMGTIAICHLLGSNLSQLDVTGIDFYGSAYYVGYGGFNAEQASRGNGRALWGQRGGYARRAVPHPQPHQIDFMRRLRDVDQRLAFDEVAIAAMQ